MKKSLLILAGALMLLTTVALPSSSAGKDRDERIGHDWHSGDMYKMESKTAHEKKFPHGHHKTDPKDDRNCYFDKAISAYFCQFDWEE